MTTLNLVYPEKSEVAFHVNKYPDGQRDLQISGLTDTSVIIVSRFNSFEDLNLIICANQALKQLGAKVHLYTPYLLGARADRRFGWGGTSYLVEVIAPILNFQNFETITVLDVHNPDVAAACIQRLKIVTNNELVRHALHELYEPNTEDNFILVSPDGGSLKKIYHIAEKIGYRGEVICCSKSRDEKGKLSKIQVPTLTPEQAVKDFIIIDDICDGGRTFTNIAEQLKVARATKNKTYLIVTHGIFSAGYEELKKYFDKIYTTNSYQDFIEPKDFVNALNIF